MTHTELLTYVATELLENNNLEVIESHFSEDYIAHSENKQFKGHKFLTQFSKRLQKAMSNLQIVKLEFLAEDSGTITWQRTLKGTHQNSIQGIPASHQTITWHEMVVTRIENDKIAEEWLLSGLMGQLLLALGKKKK